MFSFTGEDCRTSSDCNIQRGLCCKLQRRARSQPKKVNSNLNSIFIITTCAGNTNHSFVSGFQMDLLADISFVWKKVSRSYYSAHVRASAYAFCGYVTSSKCAKCPGENFAFRNLRISRVFSKFDGGFNYFEIVKKTEQLQFPCTSANAEE